MRPDAHFRQHHDVEPPRVDERTFRPAWRVRSRLDQLLLTRAISPLEWRAGARYRLTFDTAFAGVLPGSRLVRTGSARVADASMTARLDALAWLRSHRMRLGTATRDLVEACVVEDLSWAELGRRLGVDPKTARNRTVSALGKLARIGLSAFPIGAIGATRSRDDSHRAVSPADSSRNRHPRSHRSPRRL
jgi:hypothetical protein